jgi:hypothetical protein
VFWNAGLESIGSSVVLAEVVPAEGLAGAGLDEGSRRNLAGRGARRGERNRVELVAGARR